MRRFIRWSISAVRHLWSSPWTLWVGFRYLKSKKSSNFLSFITVLSIAGVTVGVTAMIVVLSVMDGFEVELKKRLMGTDLHILISPTPRVPGFEMGLVPSSSLEKNGAYSWIEGDPRVSAIWPVLSTEAILRTGRKVSGILLKGVSAEKLKEMKPQIQELAEPQMLVVGTGLKKKTTSRDFYWKRTIVDALADSW